MFDRVIVVDWSAANLPTSPTNRANAVWIGCHDAEGGAEWHHRTRAGAELARLHIIQDQGSRVLELQWTAGRAMCEDPAGEPCEWAGAAGESAHARQTQGGGLTAPLAVSADPDDPFTLHFARRPKAGQAVQGTLSSARGDIRWRVRIERDAQ